MAKPGGRRDCRRVRSQHTGEDDEQLPSIAALGASHRGNDPDEAGVLVASTHLRMAREWPVECPRFVYVLRGIGLDFLRHLQFIRLDHHLITALVERWCPRTNTFHLPIGEMTITLQDVQVLLGIRVDGPAVIGPMVVGAGQHWDSWSDCCDDLLGSHPEPGVVYQDPNDADVTSIRLRWVLPRLVRCFHSAGYVGRTTGTRMKL